MPPRPLARRKADTLALLSAPAADVWVASASVGTDGLARPYLVPLSLAWLDEHLVIALEATSRTARNLLEVGGAELAVGHTRDVVLVDAVVADSTPVEAAPAALADGYAPQSDWDPRGSAGYLYVTPRPTRVRAWREVDEIADRTLMRDGLWLV